MSVAPAPLKVAAVRRVRVRPTKNAVAFCALLVALWYAALSQGNGAAYALFFFILALGVISWLHTRRNLHGVTVSAAKIEPVFAGGVMRVPLTIRTGSGNFVAGLDVRAGGGELVRTGFVAAGSDCAVTVTAPVETRGIYPTLLVDLSSVWPLGFFVASTTVEVAAPQIVQPAPNGAQPLPAGDPGWQYDRRKGRGDGDEFAGLREFRQGESPRRIHWRAAERTDKLLIKEWEGASGGLRWLKWDDLEVVGVEPRISQLTRWVLEADRAGAPYGLRLPGIEIPPGMGAAQRARCLQALAGYPAGGGVAKAASKRRSPAIEAPILARPLGILMVSLGLAALPILTTVLPFSAALFGAAILFRLLSRERGWALRSLPVKLLICGVGIGGVILSSGSLLGLEPGMSLVVSLVALKVLESSKRRDFIVLVLLAWFMALCGLFISQTLLAFVIAATLCVFAAAAVALLHTEDRIPWWASFRRIAMLAGQGIPIIALLFLFFPRIQGGIRFSFNTGGLGAAGFSENFDPGNFAKLNENFETAFRAEFLQAEPPAPPDRYWRGLVLWECEGLRWKKGNVVQGDARVTSIPDAALLHRVTIQPHGQRWVFALDRPLGSPRGTSYESGAYLQAHKPINRSTRFEIYSLPGYREKDLFKDFRRAALQVPGNISAETRSLAETFRAAGSDAEILAAATRWFQAQGFRYSLNPQRYDGANALEDFLFRRRTGFCSHYAGSFSTLMRLAGVPARVVLGYQGGTYNSQGRYFVVKQNEAHAWCEVWIKGRGWERIDLTAQLAPSRIEAGASEFQDSIADLAGGFRAPRGLSDLIGKVRMFWDNVNYQWDLRVVAYDEDAQFELLTNLGLTSVPRPILLGGVIAGGLVCLGLAGLWLRGATRAKRDPVSEVWAGTCGQIARLTGLRRETWEGPHDYAQRAAGVRPDAAEAIHHAAAVYARIRFGESAPPLTKLREANSRLARISTRRIGVGAGTP